MEDGEVHCYPIILNSDSYYEYVTYQLSPTSLARHHVKHKKLVVYYYDEDLEIDKTGCWVLGCWREEGEETRSFENKHPSLIKVALYDVLQQGQGKYVFEYIVYQSSILNLLIEQARCFDYDVHQVSASEVYRGGGGGVKFLLDGHWLISQERVPITPEEVQTLRRMAMDKFVLLLRHKPTNCYHQLHVQERIPKAMIPLQSGVSPAPPPPLNKFCIFCKGGKRGTHPLYQRLNNTHRCRIVNCICSGLGQTAVCETCNLLHHTCIYTGCYQTVSLTYEDSHDLQQRLSNHEERVSRKIQDRLQKHITHRHPLSSTTPGIARDITVVPETLLPYQDLTSAVVLGEVLRGLGVGLGE